MAVVTEGAERDRPAAALPMIVALGPSEYPMLAPTWTGAGRPVHVVEAPLTVPSIDHGPPRIARPTDKS